MLSDCVWHRFRRGIFARATRGLGPGLSFKRTGPWSGGFMKFRRDLIYAGMFAIVALLVATRSHSQTPGEGTPRAAVVMECVASTTGFAVARFERSALFATAPAVSLNSSCADALAVLLSANLQIRSVLVPQPGSQYFVLSQ